MAFVTDSNRPPTALAASSNRLSNRFWGRFPGPFPSNASLGTGTGHGRNGSKAWKWLGRPVIRGPLDLHRGGLEPRGVHVGGQLQHGLEQLPVAGPHVEPVVEARHLCRAEEVLDLVLVGDHLHADPALGVRDVRGVVRHGVQVEEPALLALPELVLALLLPGLAMGAPTEGAGVLLAFLLRLQRLVVLLHRQRGTGGVHRVEGVPQAGHKALRTCTSWHAYAAMFGNHFSACVL